jgi:hypothetical protein
VQKKSPLTIYNNQPVSGHLKRNKMKIGIITLPFNSNYGGLLQAYALQSVLRNMGHEVWSVNRRNPIMPFGIKVLSLSNRLIKSIIRRKPGVIRSWANAKEELIIDQHTNRFLNENIRITNFLKSERDFAKLTRYSFDAYIVGSDQVWRPKYSPRLANHFLGFTDNTSNIKRVSYAASFGVDKWEYTPQQTEECRKLVSKFNAVSVREDSAINLCKDNFGIDALQVLDPTLLVDKEDYMRLVEKDNIQKCDGTLLTYVLDKSAAKQDFINKIAKETGLKEVSIMPKSLFRDAGRKKINDCIYPPVTAWLRGFMDAEYVVTDSFHGTAFAIIFNKPFLALGNAKRGLTRFTSLLKTFGLEDRIILTTEGHLTDKLYKPIDFNLVNETLNAKKQEAFKFLTDSLI